MLRLVNTTDDVRHRAARPHSVRAPQMPRITPRRQAQPTLSPVSRSDKPGWSVESPITATSAKAESRTDPRWVFAVRVSTEIDGGRAAVLVPERRERLMKLASHLRIRPFDASLIIAMVQDAARRGEDLPSPDLARRISSVGPSLGSTTTKATPTDQLAWYYPWLVAAFASAASVGLCGMLIHWINSA